MRPPSRRVERRLVLQRLVQQLGERGRRGDVLGELGEERRRGRSEVLLQVRQRGEVAAQRDEVSRMGLAEGGAAGEALEIAHPAEAATQAVAGRRIRGEGADRILSLADRRAVEERAQEPLAQEARAHGRARPVDRADERAAARPLGRGLEQLEGGDGGRVEEHRIAGHEPLDPREVRERLPLRIGEIRERGARRLQARRHRPHAEGIERRRPEAGDEAFPGGPRREPPRLAGRHRHAERFALSAP